MSLSLNKVGNFKFRTEKGRGYEFKELRNKLKEYSNNLFEEYDL